MDIKVPIVPGLKPITKTNQISSLPRIFHIELPDTLINELNKATTSKAVREVGIEWCIQQSKELKAAGVPCLHYYTMGESDTTKRIVESIY